jgi:hypothetical protein
MTKTEEIRKDILEIEDSIRFLLKQFIEKNGNCDIDIDTEQAYAESMDGKRKKLIRLSVNMKVGI